ncbi:MAG: hypothetical protein M1835_004486 [Candelina submexicana]|nr:MAG: hypothetical protein M1835_004486 [Candelina submexicana]
MDIFWAAPPVSRTLAAATLGASILVHSGLLDGRRIVFYLPWILKFPPEIWRLFTAFLLTGPQLGILFDTYFLYTYGSALEVDSLRLNKPGDFFTYLIFIAFSVIVTNGLILHGVVFTQALTLALAYTYAQENRGRQITLFVITLPVQWLPYVMLLMTSVMGGPDAALGQATGLLAAHLYDFLTRLYPEFGGGRNFIQTPALVKRWFGGNQPGPATTRSYGTAFAARSTSQQSQDASSGSSSGMATGVSNIWGSRGAGRRLGGD